MKIRADVMYDPCPTVTGTEAPDHARQCSAECRSTRWTASAQVTGGPHRRYRSQWCASWPEAMQAAYKLLADLDAQLMTEVHASRASRRTSSDTAAAHRAARRAAMTPGPCTCTPCRQTLEMEPTV